MNSTTTPSTSTTTPSPSTTTSLSTTTTTPSLSTTTPSPVPISSLTSPHTLTIGMGESGGQDTEGMKAVVKSVTSNLNDGTDNNPTNNSCNSNDNNDSHTSSSSNNNSESSLKRKATSQLVPHLPPPAPVKAPCPLPKYYDRKVQYKYLDTLGTFQNEAATLQRFPHTNIIAHVSHFRYKDLLHLVLELASHSLLDAIVNKRIDKTTFLDYTAMMAAGVAHLHRNKILHGDIKPANILITEQNVVKLADLGEVRYMANPLCRAVGTESYRAPEVTMEGNYGLPADIYSFGRTLEDMMSNTRMSKNEAFLSFAARFIEFEPDRRPTADNMLNEQFSALRVEELLEEEEMKEENENDNEKKENENENENEKKEEKEEEKEENERKEEKEKEKEEEKEENEKKEEEEEEK
ncbi:hypothetical protein BGX30_005432 [Mortierella sp. GBA39]|nr:hypothetical protein BGX30_005432 [Mortierella sp. GBA39]